MMYHYPAEFLRIIFFLALVVVVTACSGGGNGSDADTPATTNSTLLFASLTDISVAENSITTGYVAAEHSVSGANGNTITFNLSGGADQAEFTINSNSGVLSFNAAPNFEAPTDNDSDNRYVVEITASDGSNSITRTLTVIVTDVNEPLLFNSPTQISVVENNTATGYTASASNNNTITFNLSGGADQAEFTINSNSGVLSFNAAPNFEAPTDNDSDNRYVVEITASDGSNSITRTLTVIVTDDDDGPTATITFPAAKSLTSGNKVTVHGTASSLESDVTVVRVNGVDATSSDNFAHWQAVVPLSPGINTLQVETGDMARNSNINAAQAVIESDFYLRVPWDIVLDSSNNRVLIADIHLDVIMAVDLTTGIHTIISENGLLRNPKSLMLDSDNNRVLVLDEILGTLLAVDLISGAQTIISNADTPDSGQTLIDPQSAVLDNHRVLVVDNSLDALLAVDLTTGVRTIISDNNTLNGGPLLVFPIDLALDSDNNRVLLLDSGLKAILAVDLTSGIRTLISDNNTPDITNSLDRPIRLVLDSVNNRVLVADSYPNSDAGLNVIVAVDLTTGKRTIISGNTLSNSNNAFRWFHSLVLDSARNRVLVADGGLAALLAVDLTTGARTVIADDSTPDIIHTFDSPHDLIVDRTNNRLLVTDRKLKAVLAVDLTTGERTVISDSSTPNNINAFNIPQGMALDSTNNRLLVVDWWPGQEALLAVNLDTGARTIISDNNTPNNIIDFSAPISLALDPNRLNNRVLVLDSRLHAVLAVDLTTGIRTVISDNSMPNSGPSFAPTSLVLDSNNNRVLVLVDGIFIGVMAVDLNSGVRTVISGNSMPNNDNPFRHPSGLALDSANNRVFVLDKGDGGFLLAIDLTTGIRTVISDSRTILDDISDSINAFEDPLNLVFDSANNQLLVVDREQRAVIAVHLDSGERVILSR